MIGISIANSLGLNKKSGINPDAAAFIAAAGITGATEVNAVNALVNGLKADGLWSKMKAVYPFVTDNRNLASYTEDFGNAYWTKANTTATLNATTAPNGSSTADLIIPSVLSAPHVIYTQPFIGASQIVTNTIYAKAAGYNFIGLSDAATGQAVINLSNGTIVSQDAGITASTPVNVGNGWWRCVITFTATTNRGLGVDIWSDGSKTTFAGNGTSGVYLWGAQSELGSTATTYQPIATTQQAYIAAQFKYNLVNPVDSDAAFRLVFNGGWTHSSTGALPNGTNGYADTKFVPSANLTFNSASFSVYSRNNFTPTANQSFGCATGALDIPLMGGTFLSTKKLYSYAYSYNAPDLMESAANQNLAAMFLTSRTANLSAKTFRNSSVISSTITNSQVTQPSNSYFLGAFQTGLLTISGYNSFQHAFAHLGDGLTDTEASNLYTRVQAFQTALSRQV